MKNTYLRLCDFLLEKMDVDRFEDPVCRCEGDYYYTRLFFKHFWWYYRRVLQKNGGYCDCEVLYNAIPRILRWQP